MENKQTAVEWLVEQVNLDCLNSVFIKPDLIQQAKEMEKEQIIDAYNQGSYDMADKVYNPERYYNETYKTPKP